MEIDCQCTVIHRNDTDRVSVFVRDDAVRRGISQQRRKLTQQKSAAVQKISQRYLIIIHCQFQFGIRRNRNILGDLNPFLRAISAVIECCAGNIRINGHRSGSGLSGGSFLLLRH